MAELKKIVRNPQLSNFRQVAPEAGGAFRVLAQMADTAYKMLEPAAIAEQEAAGEELGRQMARQQIGDPRAPTGDTLSLIREFEGFREKPYWDVNAHRVGYGSDTITDPTGNVRNVKTGDSVTREDAERDLSRRVSTEFEPIAMNAVGADRWNTMSSGQRAALTSIAYNYGEIPDRIVGAVRSGDAAAGAAAIRGLAGDNAGVNKNRRMKEANLFASAEAPTVVRTSDGKLEGRLYSPLSGPILQAHNAAAGVAYTSEIMNQGFVDMMQMSEQFALQPQAFREAAQGYVDDIVSKAPENFRRDVRASLEKEMQRRFLGVMEDQQRDTRQRANNSSSALVDRWSQNYAEALAAGNDEEAANALTELQSILGARETLPGVAWTREQSENIILKSQDEAERLREKASKDQESAWKTTLNTIIKAAKSGLHGSDESILGDPSVAAAHPDLAREAAAFVEFRDALPGFFAAPPSARAAAVAELEGLPVQDDFQVEIVKAAKDADKTITSAFEDDQIAAANTYLPDKPPALPDLASATPEAIVNGLAARRAYVLKNMETGHFGYRAFLSDDESEALGALMGKESPPEVRMALATSIVSGFGDDANAVFNEIKGDPVTLLAGKMTARGGDPNVAMSALVGQQMIDEGLVQVPQKAARVGAFSPDIAAALDAIGMPVTAQGDLMKLTTAIYAADARGVDPTSDAADEKLSQAAQAALGQSTNKRGRVTGGVQKVGGHDVLLPPRIAGEDVQSALEKAFTPELTFAQQISPFVGDINLVPDVWEKLSGLPMVGGEPLGPKMFNKGSLQLVPVPSPTGMTYRMQFATGSGPKSVEDATGNVYMFEIDQLIEAAK